MKEALSDLLTFRLLEILLSEPKTEPQSFFEGSLKHFNSFCFFEVPGSLAFIILKGQPRPSICMGGYPVVLGFYVYVWPAKLVLAVFGLQCIFTAV